MIACIERLLFEGVEVTVAVGVAVAVAVAVGVRVGVFVGVGVAVPVGTGVWVKAGVRVKGLAKTIADPTSTFTRSVRNTKNPKGKIKAAIINFFIFFFSC